MVLTWDADWCLSQEIMTARLIKNETAADMIIPAGFQALVKLAN